MPKTWESWEHRGTNENNPELNLYNKQWATGVNYQVVNVCVNIEIGHAETANVSPCSRLQLKFSHSQFQATS